jgi:probable rRNA maturation factor
MRLIMANRLETQSNWFSASFLEELQELVHPVGMKDWNAGLVIVDNQEIKRLNSQFRDKKSVTDVLSFSHLVLDFDDTAVIIKKGNNYAADDLYLDKAEDEVGEIIIAPEFVSDRCVENSWDVFDELAMLVVHGALHLLGWDHQTEYQTKAMRKLESELLITTGRSHPLAFSAGDDDKCSMA